MYHLNWRRAATSGDELLRYFGQAYRKKHDKGLDGVFHEAWLEL